MRLTGDVLASTLKYDSCRRLIFNYDLVVKDSFGEILIKEPIKSMASVF